LKTKEKKDKACGSNGAYKEGKKSGRRSYNVPKQGVRGKMNVLKEPTGRRLVIKEIIQTDEEYNGVTIINTQKSQQRYGGRQIMKNTQTKSIGRGTSV